MDDAIGEVIGSDHQGFREVQLGNTQAWYYPAHKTIVIWECFFDDRFRNHPLSTDKNMQKLWSGFGHWLTNLFPQSTIIAAPFNDPITETIDEY